MAEKSAGVLEHHPGSLPGRMLTIDEGLQEFKPMLVKGDTIFRENIRRILLIQLGDIGDVVLTFPVIRALHEHFPDAGIVVAVREKASELIEDCQWASDVISINEARRTWIAALGYQKKFFKRLRSFQFDLAFDMRTGDRGAVLALLSGAKQKIGFFARDGKLWRNRVFTHLVIRDSRPERYMADYYLGPLEACDIKKAPIQPVHDVPEGRYQKAKALLKNQGVPLHRPIVAVQPFSLWKYKEWGADRYVQLINWLVSEYGMTVIITGSGDESGRAAEIIEKCLPGAYNLAGRTSIGTLAAVFKACRLFIGVDSAGVHIAAAVGLPTVCIFGPSSSADWAPRGRDHRIVYKHLPCLPCKDKGCQGSGVSRCLDELTFDEVKAVVKRQMDRSL